MIYTEVQIRFEWEHYKNTHEALVNSWLDDVAIKFTGLDDGWKDFYDYWMQEAKEISSCKDYLLVLYFPLCITHQQHLPKS